MDFILFIQISLATTLLQLHLQGKSVLNCDFSIVTLNLKCFAPLIHVINFVIQAEQHLNLNLWRAQCIAVLFR